MKYALIGCGRIAVNHLKAVFNNDLDLVALCDLKKDHINNLTKQFNIINICEYLDYKKMIIEHPEIELVAIATDSGVHAEIALFCLENGKHVIVEKPIALSMDDADKMIDLAIKKNLKLCVCHQNRFNEAVKKAKQALDDGRYGKLSHGAINVRWARDKKYYDQASWRGKWLSDGGALMNQCIHGIDLFRWFFGNEIEEIYGVTRRQFHDYLECEDVGMAVVKFKNGAIGTVEGTVNVYPKNLEETLTIFGENATVKIGGTSCNNIDIWDFKSENKDDSATKFLHEQTANVYGNGHTLLYKDMIESIKCNRNPYVDGKAGKNALEVVLAIYKSQLTGKPVKIPLKHFGVDKMIGIFDKR